MLYIHILTYIGTYINTNLYHPINIHINTPEIEMRDKIQP